MARSHRDWCKKVQCSSSKLLKYNLEFSTFQNLEAWEEAKKEIEKIPDHPNTLPNSAEHPGGSTSARRDSTATVNGR